MFLINEEELRIAVNTRLLLKNKLEGIGWFTYENLIRITRNHPEHEFYFLFDRKYDERFIFSDNITPVVIGPQARHPVLHYLWFEKSVPKALKKIKPDLFISPDAYCSLSTDIKTLLVIHDLNFEHYPENMPWLVRKYYKHYTPLFARKADRIATVSNYSKQDIIKQYDINPDKIDVVFNGANENFSPVNEEVKASVKLKYAEDQDYFLFIGALNPRKNLVNLFKAFDIYKNESYSKTKLLVVGEKMWWTGEIKTTFDNMIFGNDVLFTGRLQVKELRKVVGSAIALTYVSYFEGFGIPIVEAFYAGTPVITSNVTSMPEVAGDAALLIDPFNPKDIAKAMHNITFDSELRIDLIAKGNMRKKKFTWDKTSENLWQSVMKVTGTEKSK